MALVVLEAITLSSCSLRIVVILIYYNNSLSEWYCNQNIFESDTHKPTHNTILNRHLQHLHGTQISYKYLRVLVGNSISHENQQNNPTTLNDAHDGIISVFGTEMKTFKWFHFHWFNGLAWYTVTNQKCLHVLFIFFLLRFLYFQNGIFGASSNRIQKYVDIVFCQKLNQFIFWNQTLHTFDVIQSRIN